MGRVQQLVLDWRGEQGEFLSCEQLSHMAGGKDQQVLLSGLAIRGLDSSCSRIGLDPEHIADGAREC